MDEGKLKTEETSTANPEDGDQPKEAGLIDKANTAAERLEVANQKQEELINRQEELAAKQQLAGRAEAGLQAPKEIPISDKEYAEKVMKGEANPLREDGFEA